MLVNFICHSRSIIGHRNITNMERMQREKEHYPQKKERKSLQIKINGFFWLSNNQTEFKKIAIKNLPLSMEEGRWGCGLERHNNLSINFRLATTWLQRETHEHQTMSLLYVVQQYFSFFYCHNLFKFKFPVNLNRLH